MRSTAGLAVILAATLVAFARPVFAQQDEEAAAPSGPPVWQLELFGGGGFNVNPNRGSASVPPSGAIIGGRLSASSFYFGTAAQLFNQIGRAHV